ncbi:IclR family transcriptional regulator [Caballeronia sp. ATUFL_M1_KS5A]|uniref:IclR family transcriptional regulator n=1 Tax=Caballeronia sp. ATUFL_M1_KS5A TaxID=2921778 RepID=UPI0020294DF7|nr:IclR family transcriptional regulator [Caballeronia sp. ATUFL_M1_KS5A]
MNNSPDERMSPLFNQSIEKGIDVLSAFGGGRRQMSLGQIANAVGVTRSSAQRIAFTLESLGLLKKDRITRRYELSNAVMRLGCNYLESNNLINAANPFLAAINRSCDESVFLTEPCGMEMIFVASFTSRRPLALYMPIGSRMPMYCTSAGRAYLSRRTEEEVNAVLAQPSLEALTSKTCTDPVEIRALIREAAHRGYAYNDEEYALGQMNISAPICNGAGLAVASVHIQAPTSRWTLREAQQKLAPMVIECAAAVSSASALFR